MSFSEILISAVVSSIISVCLSTAVIVFFVNKLQLSINLKSNGIRRVFSKGQSIKSFEKQLRSNNCKEVKVLGFSAHGFTHSYRRDLTNLVARGGSLTLLLSKPNTAFLKDASEMEGRNATAISDSVNAAIEIIKCIYNDAHISASKNGFKCGTVTLRFFDTEIRNQLIMCTDTDNKTSAWMSILIPPLAAVDCKMIEYSDALDCEQYFETIWERHAKDDYKFD